MARLSIAGSFLRVLAAYFLRHGCQWRRAGHHSPKESLKDLLEESYFRLLRGDDRADSNHAVGCPATSSLKANPKAVSWYFVYS